MLLFPVLMIVGAFAGMLSTIAGVGGSLFVVLALSALFTPELALAVTAPALLVGNLHRLWMFREGLKEAETRRKALLFAALAGPAAFFGGLLAVELPTGLLRGLLVGVVLVAMAREVGVLRFKVTARALHPAALGTGFLTATVGGGSLLMGPAFLASGFSAGGFVAACSATSVAMHLGRIPAYAIGGWFDERAIAGSVLLALALVAGNVAGQFVRRALSERASRAATYSTLLGSAAAAIFCAV